MRRTELELTQRELTRRNLTQRELTERELTERELTVRPSAEIAILATRDMAGVTHGQGAAVSSQSRGGRCPLGNGTVRWPRSGDQVTELTELMELTELTGVERHRRNSRGKDSRQ